jgi:serine/threonine-protein kinase
MLRARTTSDAPPYRIVEQLGIGGMATVYKAYQTNMDRHVAIRCCPPLCHDPTFVGRFQQEAKVIARLEHARILPVFDYGETDGVTYIVMRFLQAGTLAERIKEGPMPLDDIARIMVQIGEGLDYAHKRGVIHRDIKPSNIMLDESGDAYITDFGISKLVEGTAQFTSSGIVGTPAYLSPGRASVSPSIIAPMLLAGRDAVPDSDRASVFRRNAVAIVIGTSTSRSPSSVSFDIPDPVEAVIMKAMARTNAATSPPGTGKGAA